MNSDERRLCQMFEMQVNNILVLNDRVLLGGNPTVYEGLPKQIVLFGNKHNVIGLSSGIRPPFISIEIEKNSGIDYKSLEGTFISG